MTKGLRAEARDGERSFRGVCCIKGPPKLKVDSEEESEGERVAGLEGEEEGEEREEREEDRGAEDDPNGNGGSSKAARSAAAALGSLFGVTSLEEY